MTFLRRRAADRIAGARPFANRISAERGAACAARLAANRRARGFSAAELANLLSVAGAKALLFLVARARLCCAAARCATVLILNAGACLMRAVFCVLNPPNPPCQGGEAARRLAAACCAAISCFALLFLTVGTAVAAVQERALFIGAPAAETVLTQSFARAKLRSFQEQALQPQDIQRQSMVERGKALLFMPAGAFSFEERVLSRFSIKAQQAFKIAAVGNVPLQQTAGSADDPPVTAPAATASPSPGSVAPSITPATPGLYVPSEPASAASPLAIVVSSAHANSLNNTNNKSEQRDRCERLAENNGISNSGLFCAELKRAEEWRCYPQLQNWLKDESKDEIKEKYNQCVDQAMEKTKYDDCKDEIDNYYKDKDGSEALYLQCKEDTTEIKNYPKCTKQIRERSQKKKAARELEADLNSEDAEKKKAAKAADKAATKAARELTKCMREQEYDKGNKTCKEEAKEVKEALKDFREECSSFVGSPLDCQRALDSCEQCDGALSGAVSGDDVDCVLIRNQGICPELASGHLKDLKEERKDYEKKIEELQKKLEDLKQERGRLEGELNDEKLQFQAEAEKMKNEEEELRESLEEGLKSAKGEIDAAMKTAVAKARAEMEKTHQLQFELSNAIEAAHRKRRDSQQKVYSECKAKATKRLSDYRKARRAAIRQGRFRKESIMQMLSQNRLTFADKDDIKFSRYYSSCMAQNKYFLQSIDEDLRVDLTKIDQQKQLIVRQLESLNRQAAALAGEADAKQKAVADDYVARLTKITHKSKRNLDSRVRVYNQKSGLLGKRISEKNFEIMQTEGILRETEMKGRHNQEMYHNLRGAGASEKDKSSELSDASRAQGNLRDAWDRAFEMCECDQGCSHDGENKECKGIKDAGRLVEPDHAVFRSRDKCGDGRSRGEGGSGAKGGQ